MHGVNLQPMPQQWLENSVLLPFVEPYLTDLRDARYAQNTRRIYLCCVAHFAYWITLERLPLRSIDKRARTRFLEEHLPACVCPYPVRRVPHDLRAAITHLLDLLQRRSAIFRDGLTTALDEELNRFQQYMRDVGGYAINTQRQRRRIVGRFLHEQFGNQCVTIGSLDAASVRRFALGENRTWSPGTIRVVGGAIGCYLNYRSLSGDDVRHLQNAIPRVAHWRLSELPDVLSNTDIDRILASFAQDFPSRRRAYGMVRCLTDLGLRCSEVVALRLEDINWHQGSVRIARSKTRHCDILPLPEATGRAIAAYLQYERPATTNRAVFARHVAPYDLPIQRGVVKRAVIEACQRSGLSPIPPHQLRHSMASRMLGAGVPIKHIADILRHRSLDTSMIYTKIDIDRLAAVAMPWPGSPL